MDDSAKYWTDLLKTQTEIIQESQFNKFGKGKRQRKQIKYVENEVKDEEFDYDPDYDAEKDSSSSSSEEVSRGSDNEAEADGLNLPKPISKKDVLKRPLNQPPSIPLFNNSPGLSVELQRKKNILNKLTVFGLPGADIKSTLERWKLTDENFTEQQFKDYLRSIYASLDFHGTKFSKCVDKFPLNEQGCQSILSKIAIIELIKDKVFEYAPHMPYMLPILIDSKLWSIDEIDGDYLELVKPYLPPDTQQISSTDALSYKILPPVNQSELAQTNSIFKFNIEDHGYTELHTVWEAENKLIAKDNIWWRYHDLWLLLGICVHGYDEMQTIFDDPRFSLLHLAFQNCREHKINFTQRRLELLEQSILIEDVIRRSIENNVYLKNESSLLRVSNRISEMCSFFESGLKIVEEYSPDDEEKKKVLKELFYYIDSICQELINDMPNLTQYIMCASLRTSQLFPPKPQQFDRFAHRLTQVPIQLPVHTTIPTKTTPTTIPVTTTSHPVKKS
ncbi:Protein let-418 [Thelohanellus kitauei]|uniref:Protein let-418 n=1 Tax=Thelohanellus kitauei TaxID=669202 RepID=A0A0C2MIY8_THEKT|nr:Protein let-418 [Thelohanellus kitauei]